MNLFQLMILTCVECFICSKLNHYGNRVWLDEYEYLLRYSIMAEFVR